MSINGLGRSTSHLNPRTHIARVAEDNIRTESQTRTTDSEATTSAQSSVTASASDILANQNRAAVATSQATTTTAATTVSTAPDFTEIAALISTLPGLSDADKTKIIGALLIALGAGEETAAGTETPEVAVPSPAPAPAPAQEPAVANPFVKTISSDVVLTPAVEMADSAFVGPILPKVVPDEAGQVATTISGLEGPYDSSTLKGQAANVGYVIAQNTKNGSTEWAGDVQYAPQNDEGVYSLDAGLAYSTESLKGLDTNEDGIITTAEAGVLGSIIDLNGDSVVSAGENLAFTVFQDCTDNMDGIVTEQESNNAIDMIIADTEYSIGSMQEIYDGLNIADREKNFVMPDLAVEEEITPDGYNKSAIIKLAGLDKVYDGQIVLLDSDVTVYAARDAFEEKVTEVGDSLSGALKKQVLGSFSECDAAEIDAAIEYAKRQVTGTFLGFATRQIGDGDGMMRVGCCDPDTFYNEVDGDTNSEKCQESTKINICSWASKNADGTTVNNQVASIDASQLIDQMLTHYNEYRQAQIDGVVDAEHPYGHSKSTEEVVPTKITFPAAPEGYEFKAPYTEGREAAEFDPTTNTYKHPELIKLKNSPFGYKASSQNAATQTVNTALGVVQIVKDETGARTIKFNGQEYSLSELQTLFAQEDIGSISIKDNGTIMITVTYTQEDGRRGGMSTSMI